MKIESAEFCVSNTDYKKCPKPDKPEFAFIGRSNVGKSSLINMLCGRSNLAKTSSKPGKTQLINHFLINKEWYLVDLPGYGWAKISATQREKWGKMIKDYLLYRENLQCVLLLIDLRIEPQKIDLEFMEWMANSGIAFVIVFTKSDKISKNAIKAQVASYNKELKERWEELPQSFISSSETKLGRDEVLDFIEEVKSSYKSIKTVD